MKSIGLIICSLVGIMQFIWWYLDLIRWIGFFWGTLISFFAAPLIVFHPFIFWITEGSFPTLYFVVWGGGLLGAILYSYGKES